MATTSPPHLASSLTCHQDNHLRSHSHSQSESQSADSDFILQLFPYMAPSATALSAADLSKLPPFPPIERPLYDGAHYSIGRRVDKKRKSAFDEADDGADHDEAMICFRSKVVSRQHAELWYDNGMLHFRDSASSSGTFINRLRLSPSGKPSRPYVIESNDIVQLGVDYQGRQEDLYKCVVVRIVIRRREPRGDAIRLAESISLLSASFIPNSPRSPSLETLLSPTFPKVINSSTHDCCICLSSLCPPTALFVAPCAHTFHFKCVWPILNGGVFGLCPLCRSWWNLWKDDSDKTHTSVKNHNRPRHLNGVETSDQQVRVASHSMQQLVIQDDQDAQTSGNFDEFVVNDEEVGMDDGDDVEGQTDPNLDNEFSSGSDGSVQSSLDDQEDENAYEEDELRPVFPGILRNGETLISNSNSMPQPIFSSNSSLPRRQDTLISRPGRAITFGTQTAAIEGQDLLLTQITTPLQQDVEAESIFQIDLAPSVLVPNSSSNATLSNATSTDIESGLISQGQHADLEYLPLRNSVIEDENSMTKMKKRKSWFDKLRDGVGLGPGSGVAEPSDDGTCNVTSRVAESTLVSPESGVNRTSSSSGGSGWGFGSLTKWRSRMSVKSEID